MLLWNRQHRFDARRHCILTGLAVLALGVSPAWAFEASTVTIPMRDGIKLATDVMVPSGGARAGTILIRTPYGKDMLDDESATLICDQLGFAFVSQDMRGRDDSEGVDEVFLTDGWGELQDGYDTVDWIVNQSWSNGKVGFFGASAMGVASYLGAGSLHPGIATVHVGVAPWTFYDAVYMGGSFREALVVDWLQGQDSDYMIEVYQEHEFYDELWALLDMRVVEDKVEIPMFHWGGWHDIFSEGPTDAFSRMQGGGPTGIAGYQELVMGGWTHVDGGAFDTRQGELEYPADSIFPILDKNPVAWFQRYLQGKNKPSVRQLQYPVLLWVMGGTDVAQSAGNRWYQARHWPLNTSSRRLYLNEGRVLSEAAPTVQSGAETVRFDPADPSPTIGGRELSLPAGPRNQAPLLLRDDVVAFETAPLTSPLQSVGQVKMVLFGSSSAADTDFTVRLVDLYPDGRSMLVSDGILRARYREGRPTVDFLEPGEVALFEVDLGETAQVFDVGHRVQVLIASSNSRRFKVAANTQDEFWAEVPGVVADNTIYFGDLYPSHLELSVPRAGELLPTTVKSLPEERKLRRMLARARAGKRLSPDEQEQLEAYAGKRLMEAMLEQTAAR